MVVVVVVHVLPSPSRVPVPSSVIVIHFAEIARGVHLVLSASQYHVPAVIPLDLKTSVYNFAQVGCVERLDSPSGKSLTLLPD